jgi:hypothetical protein
MVSVAAQRRGRLVAAQRQGRLVFEREERDS